MGEQEMKKFLLLLSMGVMVCSSAYSFAPDYEQKFMAPLQSEDTAEIAKQLNVLQASIDALCIKSRGFTANVISPDFYEYHSFLNLTIKYLQEASYDVSERIRSLGGWANISVADIQQKSKIVDVKSVITRPEEMVALLLQDYVTVSNGARGIFRMAASVGDGGTIALMVKTTNQLEHFLWELSAMAGSQEGYKK